MDDHPVLAAERQTYEEIWGLEAYAAHAPGEHYVATFAAIAGKTGTVLDAGCGSGKGAQALDRAGYAVMMCDLTAEGLLPELRGRLPFQEACLWLDLSTLAYLARTWYGAQRFPSQQFDFVYCCDVLEHIPTAFVMLVVARLMAVAREGAFFSVALVPDQFGAWVGKPLHQTIQSYTWWRDNLRELGYVADARDLGKTALFFVRPR